MSAYEELLDLAGEAVKRRNGKSAQLLCPAHDDRNPSLVLSQGEGECAVLHCQTGCPVEEVLAAWGLSTAALFDSHWGNGHRRPEPIAIYAYTDEAGTPLLEVGRFPGKQFLQRRPRSDPSDWKGGIRGVRRVLYRLPKVIAAIQAGQTIYVVEGEEDVHAVEHVGGVATCNPMGAGKWLPEFTEQLRGADVIVVADRDEAGREHAASIAAALDVSLVEARTGKDARDHLRAGHGLDEFVDVAEAEATAPSSEPRAKLIVLDTYRMLTTEPPPIGWLVDGVFARGKFTLFGGREKRGKSLVQLAFAVAMASGATVLAGITVTPGKVLLIDAENGEDEIHRRLRAFGLAPKYSANLVVAEARGIDLRNDMKEITALIEKHAPKLVLLDSFRSLWRGSEKDEDEIANALYPVASFAHESGVAISLTHHATKADGGDYRGSTAIGAAPDWIAMLARDESDPEKATRRVLTTPYVRFAAERPARWMTIESDEDDGPISLASAAPYEPERESPVRDELEAKLTEWVRVRWCSPLNGDRTTAPPAWTKAELARALGRKEKDWGAHQAINRLIERGDLWANGRRWSPADSLFTDEENDA